MPGEVRAVLNFARGRGHHRTSLYLIGWTLALQAAIAVQHYRRQVDLKFVTGVFATFCV